MGQVVRFVEKPFSFVKMFMRRRIIRSGFSSFVALQDVMCVWSLLFDTVYLCKNIQLQIFILFRMSMLSLYRK